MRLIGSKTNQCGAPTTAMSSRSVHPFLCPVSGALILLQARKDLSANIPAALYTSRQERLVCILTEDEFGSIKRATIHTGKGPAGLARAPCAQDGLNTRTALVRMLSQSSSTVAGF
ncbi:hypothetical protein PC128_g12508 [Phytophthora cactorum]|nr:hypothetical protein PC128_g12508 [Phytophthora cactorum]